MYLYHVHVWCSPVDQHGEDRHESYSTGGSSSLDYTSAHCQYKQTHFLEVHVHVHTLPLTANKT